jgi:hypothetical protein
MVYKHARKPLAQIARELNVDAVVEVPRSMRLSVIRIKP